MIARDLPMIDMAELVRLHICEELNDTYTWVAPRPEMQQVAAAGAQRLLRVLSMLTMVARLFWHPYRGIGRAER
ncbi:hypothetical protein Tco_1170624, partial [Tanacetum coccineum]